MKIRRKKLVVVTCCRVSFHTLKYVAINAPFLITLYIGLISLESITGKISTLHSVLYKEDKWEVTTTTANTANIYIG